MVLILTATDLEQQTLRASLQNAERRVLAHRNAAEGRLAGRPVTLLETGIGAVNTAQALTAALQTYRPDLVLQTGVGGAYLASGLDVGDLALATAETYGDLGLLTRDGWQSAEAIGIPILRKDRDYYNRFDLDPGLVARAEIAVAQTVWDAEPPTLRTGPFVTVQQCSGLAARGNELAARFGGICENMEGAAAAHLCVLYSVPFLELRGVSNRVEDRNFDAWDRPLAAGRAQQATGALVENMEL